MRQCEDEDKVSFVQERVSVAIFDNVKYFTLRSIVYVRNGILDLIVLNFCLGLYFIRQYQDFSFKLSIRENKFKIVTFSKKMAFIICSP